MTKTEIKHLRKKLNLNQEEFASQLDVNVSTVKAWETGRRNPTENDLASMDTLEAQGVAVVELYLTGKGYIHNNKDAQKPRKHIIEKAEETYLQCCEEYGCNPNIGIRKGAMVVPSKPCWLRNFPIKYVQKDGKWTQE